MVLEKPCLLDLETSKTRLARKTDEIDRLVIEIVFARAVTEA